MDQNTTQTPSITSQTDNQQHAFFYTGELEQNFWGHIFEELYKSQIYNPYLSLNKVGSVVVSIGANVGLVTEFLSRHFEKVFALEPSTEHFNNLSLLVNGCKIVENGTGRFVEVAPIENVTIIKKALFMENGEFMFGGPTNNKTMKSLHMATWQDGKPEEKVQTITLEKLFEDYKIEHCHLLKADLEGSEFEVFAHPSFKNVAHKIDTIICEAHSWAGRHRNQLNEAFKNAGFDIESIPNSADLLVAKRRK